MNAVCITIIDNRVSAEASRVCIESSKKGKNDLIFDRFLSKFSIVDHKTKKRIFITLI